MTSPNKESIWIDVIEDVPGRGCNTTSIRLDRPLRGSETMRHWLEAHGYRDIIDFRVIIGERVMPWAAPELEWLWIEHMTEPYSLISPDQS